MSSQESIFAAVFPPPADVIIPTPTATPVLGSSAFGESFGGPLTSDVGAEGSAAEQIKWARAWHTATAFLSLPNDPITAAHASQEERTLKAKWIKPLDVETTNAISYLLSEDSRGRQLRRHSIKDDLLQWYYEEVGSRHYVDYVLPGLIKRLNDRDNTNALFEVFQTLQIAQTIYLHPLKHHIVGYLPNSGGRELAKARANLHGLFAHSIPQDAFGMHLSRFLEEQACTVLNIGSEEQPYGASEVSEARQFTVKVMRSLSHVGLAGGRAQRLFAEVMNHALTRHIEDHYAGKWSTPSTVPDELRSWIENHFARFVVEVLAFLHDDAHDEPATLTKINHADVQRWQEMGISQLGALRVSELFNVVVDWDNGSRGAVEDLKSYVVNPNARLHLTQDFSEVLSHRLLQPGASTTQILQVYISIIRSFAFLDPKGVLLDRVARPIRRYLRERDDAVNIVVGGLLANPEEESTGPEVLTDLAVELDRTGGLPVEEGKAGDDGDLDWDDMDWAPDPVDAPPEYKRSKHNDVIGALISLFDSKDTFIKDFQKTLGERLLRREHNFDKEIRVLELLKIRFGEPSLQACEVMLRDILDSRRLDVAIRNDARNRPTTASVPDPNTLTSKVLSHLFWPSLHTESFTLPPPIITLQTRYATIFESLKPSRKLTWLPSLGQVTVHLDLDDRVVREDVHTWQASVIYAFDSDASGRHCAPVVKTVQELVSHLEMSEVLVRNALTFWVSKLVLAQSAPDTYRVLESLPSDTDAPTSAANVTAQAAAASDAVSSAAAATTAVRSEEEMQSEKMEVFWQFVVGMLTNQGQMKLDRIVMMLKMVVPGGFPFGNEEMGEFLGTKVEEGKLEVVSGGYRIVH